MSHPQFIPSLSRMKTFSVILLCLALAQAQFLHLPLKMATSKKQRLDEMVMRVDQEDQKNDQFHMTWQSSEGKLNIFEEEVAEVLNYLHKTSLEGIEKAPKEKSNFFFGFLWENLEPLGILFGDAAAKTTSVDTSTVDAGAADTADMAATTDVSDTVATTAPITTTTLTVTIPTTILFSPSVI